MTRRGGQMPEKTALKRIILMVSVAVLLIIFVFAQQPASPSQDVPEYLVVTDQRPQAGRAGTADRTTPGKPSPTTTTASLSSTTTSAPPRRTTSQSRDQAEEAVAESAGDERKGKSEAEAEDEAAKSGKQESVEQAHTQLSTTTEKPAEESQPQGKTKSEPSEKEKPNMVDSDKPVKNSALKNTTVPPTQDASLCDAECQAFKEYMGTWPSSKVKGAIYFLMKMSPHNVRRLKLALRALDKYVLSRWRYPVIIFHEQNFHSEVERIRPLTSSRIFFQLVHFEIPDFLEQPVPAEIPGCNRDVSYRHMCRFQCKLVYEQPITEGLDYMWRMDDDSFILAPLTFDIFQYMEERELEYGYMVIGSDIPGCVVGLWEAVREYVQQQRISTPFYKKWKYPRYYYNNFEVSKRSIWVSEQYKEYIDFIDHKGGLYYHRWGDAPVKSLAVSLFVPENRTFCFQDIVQYHHTIWGLPEGFLKQKET